MWELARLLGVAIAEPPACGFAFVATHFSAPSMARLAPMAV